jgi:AraC family ethanolamine operon transcriptional activator
MNIDSPNLVYEQRATDDIDEMFSWDEGWEFDYLQLSRGKLGFRSRSVQIGKLRVEYHSYDQRVLFRDALNTTDLAIALVVSSQIAPRFAGREISGNTVLIHQAGREKEYLVEPGTTTLHISVESELLGQLDCDVPRDFLRQVSQQTMSRVVEVCDELVLLAESPGKVNSWIEATSRERILSVLRNVIAEKSVAADDANVHQTLGHREFLLTRSACDCMARHGFDATPAVGEIAEELDVSERTLYNAFRHWLGVGPYEYYLTRKLHVFRNELMSGPTFPGKVTRAAFAAGFNHLGQLGQVYRRHFGETPSQTLKRRAT